MRRVLFFTPNQPVVNTPLPAVKPFDFSSLHLSLEQINGGFTFWDSLTPTQQQALWPRLSAPQQLHLQEKGYQPPAPQLR